MARCRRYRTREASRTITTPQLIEVKRHYPEYGIRSCDWERYPTLAVFKDMLCDRFDRKYMFRMINGETLARWQVLLDSRFDEVAPFYDRAIRMYTATDDGETLIDGIFRERSRRETEERDRRTDRTKEASASGTASTTVSDVLGGSDVETAVTDAETGSTSTAGGQDRRTEIVDAETAGSSTTGGTDTVTTDRDVSTSETAPTRTLSRSGTVDKEEALASTESVTDGGTQGVTRSDTASTAAGGTDTVTADIATVERTVTATPSGSETVTTSATDRRSDTPDTVLPTTLPAYAETAGKVDSTQTTSFASRQDTTHETAVHDAADVTETDYGKTETRTGSGSETIAFGKTVDTGIDETRTTGTTTASTETETLSGPRTGTESEDVETATAYGRTEATTGTEDRTTTDTTLYGRTDATTGTEDRTVETTTAYGRTSTGETTGETGSSSEATEGEDMAETVDRTVTERDLFNYLEAVNTNLDGWKNLFKTFVDDFERCFICVWW